MDQPTITRRMANRLNEQRQAAVLEAIDRVVEEAGSVNQAAKLLGLKQQTLHRVMKMRTVGELVADHVALYYRTTLDGLVRHITQESGPVRAGDLIGWREAVDEARRTKTPKLEDWAWHRAADIELPMAPDAARPEFAYALAFILAQFCEMTHVSVKLNSR